MQAASRGETKYTTISGSNELKDVVAEKFKRENQKDCWNTPEHPQKPPQNILKSSQDHPIIMKAINKIGGIFPSQSSPKRPFFYFLPNLPLGDALLVAYLSNLHPRDALGSLICPICTLETLWDRK